MNSFAHRLLAWFDHSGRKDLPWQHDINPYRVWVSEIMLQQTQVSTVIPYFERFMATFPTVDHLAAAPIDEVLHHWTGLGYYARARNLHRAAQQVMTQFDGRLPSTVEALIGLPGIGVSTAGAIVSIALGGRAPILDGNVKRVLARHRGIDGWPGQTAVSRRLWEIAEAETPQQRVADYTQAIMDLGATLCRRGQPDCGSCPVSKDCVARREGAPGRYPGRKPKRALPLKRRVYPLVLSGEGEVLLWRRAEQGIWGGLWCFPEFDDEAAAMAWLAQSFPADSTATVVREPALRHTFSHFQLELQPLRLQLTSPPSQGVSEPSHAWFSLHQPGSIGLPAPVAAVLERLRHSSPTPEEIHHD